ncbi:MAG TPA: response regulator transcription factor [Ideonella sp.]|uniref:response regulator transcription factor n=1 Tax=Ideonella sp. TaxID=1929293 RepID=UPI002C290850|nr:response regulator transcription factor [Ideonella sp.]HSI51557.1 response regulator transcription factor [Ideonella sp.]
MNVLLIDDHALFREGLALLLRPLQADLVVFEAGSCEEAQTLLAVQPDMRLVLMDLGLPGMSGLEGIAWLRVHCPDAAVVALSSADDRETVLSALDAGAMGFIPKSSNSSVLIGALGLVLAKGIYLPPSVFLTGPAGGRAPTRWVDHPPTESAPPSDVQVAHAPVRTPADLGLTPRQTDVLDLILQGKAAKLIGRELGLAPGTVKAHTSAVLRALNATTRTQAVVAAGRLGLRLSR